MRRRANEFFSLENLTQLTLFAVGMLVALAMGYPQFFPQLTRGANCANLPHPPGGNQRSLLQHNDDSQNLELEVVVDNVGTANSEYVLSPTQPFTVQVIFRNRDVSPMYLYYNAEGVVDADRILSNEALLANQTTPGLYLVFYRVTDPIDPPGLASLQIPQQTYFWDDLYVLQAGQNCNVRIEVNPSNNAVPNFAPGETYRLVAYYQNADPGIFPVPNLTPTATAIPGLTDTQGVWDGGRIRSQAVQLIFPQ